MNSDERMEAAEARRDLVEVLDLIKTSTESHNLIVRNLIVTGARINEKDANGQYPLHLAAKLGNVNIVKILLDAGSVVNAKCSNRRIPLHLAAAKPGNSKIVRLLVDTFADVNAYTIDHYTPLDCAASVRVTNFESVRILLNAGGTFRIMKARPEDNHQLRLAVESGDDEMVGLLLRAGMDVDSTTDPYGDSLLHLAVNSGHQNIVEFLLRAGADVNAENSDGKTPLFLGVVIEKLEIVRILISFGADLESTALHEAVEKKNVDILKLLLNAGSDLNAPQRIYGNEFGDTPLHLAIEADSNEIVRMLINAGACVNAINGDGYTPLELIMEDNEPESSIENMLREAGAVERFGHPF